MKCNNLFKEALNNLHSYADTYKGSTGWVENEEMYNKLDYIKYKHNAYDLLDPASYLTEDGKHMVNPDKLKSIIEANVPEIKDKLLAKKLYELSGIKFNYKLDSTLSSMEPKMKMSATQLEGYLKKKGVSPKEIEQSGLLHSTDTKSQPISYWLNKIKDGNHHINTTEVKKPKFADITLHGNGESTNTYKEILSTINKPTDNAPKVTHFNADINDINKNEKPIQTLLGWRRTHEDLINGKPTTVLNEFQSDWAQSERAGKGIFNNTVTKNREEINKLMYKRKKLHSEGYATGSPEIDNITNRLLKIYEINNGSHIVDFPMSEQKHHQLQIVGAIDEAIKNGTNRVAIPIERQNELYGTEGVTKFYDSLNKKILPDIRKKLEKQGMRISISKEKYIPNIVGYVEDDNAYNSIEKILYDYMSEHRNNDNINNGIVKRLKDALYINDGEHTINPGLLKKFNFGPIQSKVNDELKKFEESIGNPLHVLNIVPVKGRKVRWDVYSMLGAIGLGGLGDKLKKANSKKN